MYSVHVTLNMLYVCTTDLIHLVRQIYIAQKIAFKSEYSTSNRILLNEHNIKRTILESKIKSYNVFGHKRRDENDAFLSNHLKKDRHYGLVELSEHTTLCSGCIYAICSLIYSQRICCFCIYR